METVASRTETPGSAQEAAALLRASERVRIRGGGTRSGWGHVTPAPDVVLLTAGLDSVVEHN